jgi:gliding motility-associated-like protein
MTVRRGLLYLLSVLLALPVILKAQNCAVIVLPDTVNACPNTVIQLNATLGVSPAYPAIIDTVWSPAAGLSDIHSLNPFVTVGNSPLMYYLTIKAWEAQNLVVNGDFSGGTTGFTSDYVYATGGTYGPLSTEGEYIAVTDPSLAHIDFTPFGDHTTGTGQMLVINGASVANQDIWCQTISVTPNTEYDFSTWGATAFATSPAILQFSINGVLLGAPFNLPAVEGVWAPFNATWNSGSATTATICIVNQNTSIFGNDFALDDIHFHTMCTASDSVYINLASSMNAAFSHNIVDSCDPYNVAFTNTSTYSGATPQFTWSFGDGTSFGGAVPPMHSYPDTGVYQVILIAYDPAACIPFDTAVQTIHLSGFRVTADFQVPEPACGLTNIALVANTSGAQTLLWDLGDGTTSTDAAFTHGYSGEGSYTITLTAYNPASCNKTDTAQHSVAIKPAPVADFIYSPPVPVTNQPIQYTNSSQNATAYLWTFGDGAGSEEENPAHLYMQTGSFMACLIARNGDCVDTACKTIFSDASFMADVPTAFSPNGDGSNELVYVRGAGIQSVDFKIYNRWGQLVFETFDLSRGWDGNFNGQKLEMDAYGFVLHVIFLDGSAFNKTGNITLLR